MSSVKLTTTGGNGGTVELKGPVDTTSNAAVQLTLPVDDGAANQVLTTNGSGALSWAAPVIADDSIVEAKLDVSNAPTNGQFLQAQSGEGGGLTWATPSSGTALTGSTNNTVCTVTGANAIQGESNVQIDGNGRLLIGTTTEGAANADEFTVSYNNAGVAAGDQGRCGITIRSGANTSSVNQPGYIYFSDGTSGSNEYIGAITYNHENNYLMFGVNDGERLRIQSDGDVKITDGDLIIGTGGHGIDFSAQTATAATNASTDAELLDHYEEGQWTPTITVGSLSTAYGNFTRVGRLVYASCYIVCGSDVTGSSSYPAIGGLPFSSRGNPGTDSNGVGWFGYNTMNTASDGPWTINFGKWSTSFVTYGSQGGLNNADKYTSKVMNIGIMYEAA